MFAWLLGRSAVLGVTAMPVSEGAPLQRGPARAAGGSGRPDGRLRCDARARVAPQNSLRAPWALRSDSCGESVLDARCARRPRPCASRRSRRHPEQTPAAAAKLAGRHGSLTASVPALLAALSSMNELVLRELRSPPNGRTLTGSFLQSSTTLFSADGGGLRRACGSPRRAGGEARARSALRPLARGSCPSAAPEGREASSAAGPRTRAPQGSRPLGPTDPPKRLSPPPFAGRETVDTCWQAKTPAISKTKHH